MVRRACALTLLFAWPIHAQSTNASLTGRVTDPSKAVIADARVAAISGATGLRYETRTNASGEYFVANLPPNTYVIEVEKPGFKNMIKPDVALHVQDALKIDFEMALGTASETISVEAGAPLVNTESGTVSTVVDRPMVENLPLNGRSADGNVGGGPGTIQREWTARGRQLFHRGWSERQFRSHRL
jgi:hypothetical protein